jgi:hypothetical protein
MGDPGSVRRFAYYAVIAGDLILAALCIGVFERAAGIGPIWGSFGLFHLAALWLVIMAVMFALIAWPGRVVPHRQGPLGR